MQKVDGSNPFSRFPLQRQMRRPRGGGAAFGGCPRLERRRRPGARTERAPAIEDRLRAWEEANEALHAPSLIRFEVANALTRNIAAGKIDSGDAKVAWQRIVAMEISVHGLTGDGPSTQRSQRRSSGSPHRSWLTKLSIPISPTRAIEVRCAPRPLGSPREEDITELNLRAVGGRLVSFTGRTPVI